MPIPIFSAATHKYTTPDGKPLISVTQALKAAGLIDDQWFNDDAAWRGSCVHRTCELSDRGTLAEDSVDPAAAGYLAGWRAFLRNFPMEFESIEQPLYHPQLLYGGTPDRLTKCQKVIDIKTGPPQRWHKLQKAAYVHLAPVPRAWTSLGVHLDGDCGYSLAPDLPADLNRDFAVFCSALNIAKWKG